MSVSVYKQYCYRTLADGTQKRYETYHKYHLKSKPHGIPLTESQIQDVMTKYNSGVTIKRLATDFNVTRYMIKRVISEYSPVAIDVTTNVDVFDNVLSQKPDPFTNDIIS